ncbi:MAG TPA: UDP-N-acetylmuramate dehydrogenase [Patescibacteria group bacterium]|nr:UDP-N-acetylmuramate dehydrogenase [Patescibacteria group bacterium]
MEILENVPLKPYTSMYVGGAARYFVEARSVHDIKDALVFARQKRIPYFVLGGGSNILVSDSGFNGLVIHIALKGRDVVQENDQGMKLIVGAGENWDDLVKFCVEHGLYGVENMSHVPGSVGASVVQNVGCYGQEVSDVVESVRLLHVETLQEVVWANKELRFSYRQSRLNRPEEDKGKYIVTAIIFSLKKNGELNLSYGDIQKYFELNPSISPSLETVRQAVTSIRDAKFPYPDSPQHGTAGSFWNADTVDEETYEQIIQKLDSKGYKEKASTLRKNKNVFEVAQGFKVPYAVLIETIGFKGRVQGGVKILETHAGVINNFSGNGTAQQVFELSQQVIDAVKSGYGVVLKREPELVGVFS